MLNKLHFFTCPVCGYPNLSESPYDDNGCASFSVCPCCGTEFGYDDFTAIHAILREKWIANGMKWWSKNSLPPDNWNSQEQLKKFLITKSISKINPK
jgi:hypothetical protein